MSSAEKIILFVGQTFPGRSHDYALLKKEFSPQEGWFTGIDVLLDSGYQGVQKDYQGECIRVPHKKPRKSKHNPKPRLSKAQKTENRALAKLRIFVEHAIGGIKRYRILVTPYRNHRANFEDGVVVISAGLWNFWLR